jgi:hypothetical protein
LLKITTAITRVTVDIENVPMVNVITSNISIKNIHTPIVVIGDLGTTGIDMQENIPPYASMGDITVKVDT